MEENFWIKIFLIASGIFAMLGSILNWDFFFESRKAKTFVNILGRKGARIFYLILGIVVISMSFLS